MSDCVEILHGTLTVNKDGSVDFDSGGTGDGDCPKCGEEYDERIVDTDAKGEPYERFRHGDDWCYQLPEVERQ